MSRQLTDLVKDSRVDDSAAEEVTDRLCGWVKHADELAQAGEKEKSETIIHAVDIVSDYSSDKAETDLVERLQQEGLHK